MAHRWALAFVGAIGLTVATTQLAAAADWAVKTQPAAYGWAGWYAGINAGGGMANAGFWDPDCFSCANAELRRGFGTIGGQAGYNWQYGSGVFGVEGDLNWVSLNESAAFSLHCCDGGTASAKLDAFGTLRARAGLAFDHTLFYATAGAAYGHFDSSLQSLGRFPFLAPDSGWRFGVAAGAGVEFAVAPNWTLRGEYLHLEFVDKVVQFDPQGHTIFTNSAQLARLGLNYKPGTFAPVERPSGSASNWTGLYIGVNGGGGVAAADLLDPDCFNCANPTFRKAFATIGGQAGYNWQFGSAVLGLEGDLNWASLDASQTYALGQGPSNAGTARAKFDAFGSLRARAGLALDRTLAYVTAGPAWGHFGSVVQSASPFLSPDDGSHLGIAAGAGVEYQLAPSWSVRGEYLYLDFVDKTFQFDPQGRTIFGSTAQLARLGLNYKVGEPAIAANRRNFAIYKAPPRASAHDWTGWYIGINGGGGVANADMLDPDCFSCADPTFRKGFATIGGQAGYNYQFGATVLGLETDLNWVSLDAKQPFLLDAVFPPPGTARVKFDGFGSLRARAGLASDRSLIYVTAGPAWGHFNSSLQSASTDAVQAFDNAWHPGIAAGAGLEFQIAATWTLRSEYLYLNFVDKTYQFNSDSRTTFTNSAQLARIGLNYKLGSPIVANR